MNISSLLSYFGNYFKSDDSIIKHIIWFDNKVDSKENTKYKEILKNTFSNTEILFTKDEKELGSKIELIKFEAFILIVNGLNFMKIVNFIRTKTIYSIPLICIFTRSKQELKEKINANDKKYLEDNFYNRLGICETIEEVIDSIQNLDKQVKDKLNGIHLGNTENPKNYDNCFTFEYIDQEYKLIFPYLYSKIMNNKKLSNDEIKETNKFILENYGEIETIKNMILPLLFTDDIPENILAKFWSRIYTCESPFYRNLNNSLMKLENQNYNTFIQLLYIGLTEYIYKEKDILYRGANISDKDMDNLINYYKNREKKDKLENCYLIYSRAYLSFSKDEKTSIGFIGNIPGTQKVLFRLKNEMKNNVYSNAYLNSISYISSENEVLFFPYSSFIIEKIKLENNIYYVDIVYLGVYEKKIKESYEMVKDKPELFKEITEKSNFCKDTIETNIMLNKNIHKEAKIDIKEEDFEQILINKVITYNEEKNMEKNKGKKEDDQNQIKDEKNDKEAHEVEQKEVKEEEKKDKSIEQKVEEPEKKEEVVEQKVEEPPVEEPKEEPKVEEPPAEEPKEEPKVEEPPVEEPKEEPKV